jgi:hypothetical protein
LRKGDLDAAEHPIDVMLLATDPGMAKEVRGDRVGLPVLLERDGFVTLSAMGDRPRVTRLLRRWRYPAG